MKPWKILAVDDDADVLQSLVYTLEDLVILGRPLEISTAQSAADAELVLDNDKDFAVLIIDVSMEKPNAGLTLVDRVRVRYGMDVARILLRTGQPGDVMQKAAVSKHEINDYIEKSTSDRWRIENAVLTAIRAYDQLHKYKRLQGGLKTVLQFSTDALIKEQLTKIAHETVTHLGTMFARPIQAALAFQGKTTSYGDVALTVLASVGDSSQLECEQLGTTVKDGVWQHPVKEKMQQAINTQIEVLSDTERIVLFQPSFNRSIAVWLSDESGFDGTDAEIIEFFRGTLKGILERWALLRDRMIETSLSMGILAHEFRTPIASLQMTCEFLKGMIEEGRIDKTSAQRMLDNAESILGSMTTHIDRSIDNVRFVVNSEVKVNSSRQDVGSLVQHVLRMHKMVFAAAGEVQTEIDEDVFANVDGQVLEQAIVNLLSNATKAVVARKTRASGAQVRVKVTSNAHSVLISVGDQGVGMAPDKLARIFEPFFSSNETPSHGLGLTMVKKSLSAMGGDVTCQSTQGVGTEFLITLPISRA